MSRTTDSGQRPRVHRQQRNLADEGDGSWPAPLDIPRMVEVTGYTRRAPGQRTPEVTLPENFPLVDGKPLSRAQFAVLLTMRSAPMTDWQIANRYPTMFAHLCEQSDASLRTRRTELVKLGLVAQAGREPANDRHRSAARWKLTETGEAAAYG